MSRSVIRKKIKIIKKENTIRKAKKKKIILALICVLIAALIIALGIYSATPVKNSGDSEIYSYGGQTVQLFADGKFTANISHNTQKSGTYTKTADGSRTLIRFYVNGSIENGRIENNSLYLPAEWDDSHGHGIVFPRVN
ncbi:MAG: hypothetical protein FWC03_07660 [Treponema sp.]|nr:hypothetical protein [Treponema sp.]